MTPGTEFGVQESNQSKGGRGLGGSRARLPPRPCAFLLGLAWSLLPGFGLYENSPFKSYYTKMYEFVPEARRVHSNAQFDDETDSDYEVFLFYPSRNEHHQFPAVITNLEDDASSDGTAHDEPMIASPTYTIDTDFSFPDTVHDDGISRLGYSKIFRTGLWAQRSSRITEHLDALIEKAFAKLRALRQRLARRPSAIEA
ncbi:hypothetical protein ACG7TL_003659 [Trametes sanguinea]